MVSSTTAYKIKLYVTSKWQKHCPICQAYLHGSALNSFSITSILISLLHISRVTLNTAPLFPDGFEAVAAGGQLFDPDVCFSFLIKKNTIVKETFYHQSIKVQWMRVQADSLFFKMEEKLLYEQMKAITKPHLKKKKPTNMLLELWFLETCTIKWWSKGGLKIDSAEHN